MSSFDTINVLFFNVKSVFNEDLKETFTNIKPTGDAHKYSDVSHGYRPEIGIFLTYYKLILMQLVR